MHMSEDKVIEASSRQTVAGIVLHHKNQGRKETEEGEESGP